MAAHAEAERHAAVAEAERARESERRAYAAAQDALEQVAAARQELQRTYRRERSTA
jgi:phage protein D